MNLPKHLLYPILFIFLAGIFAGVQFYFLGIPYAAKEEAPIALIAEIFLSLLILYYVKKHSSWQKIGFSNFSAKNLLWISPLLALNILGTTVFLSSVVGSSPSASVYLAIGVTLVETFLIGFAEETMFRGILLRGLLKKHNVFLAMLFSAVGFSLLHSINIFAGFPFTSMLDQLGSTFLFGLLLAPLAILTRNLWPLILCHFLWDFTGLAKVQLPASFELSGAYGSIIVINQMIQYLFIIIAWIAIFIVWKRGKINQLIDLE